MTTGDTANLDLEAADADPLRLMQLHMEALYTLTHGRITGVNQWDGGTPPRFHLGRTGAGHVFRCREDVPSDLSTALGKLVREEPVEPGPRRAPEHANEYLQLLAEHEPVQRIWQGPAYALPVAVRLPVHPHTQPIKAGDERLLDAHLADWKVDVGRRAPLVAAIHGGHAVAVCASARETGEACEAGVETAPPFRRHGHALRAVAAWAELVRRSGRLPLYSTSWDNVASQALAKKLGFVQIGVDYHLT